MADVEIGKAARKRRKRIFAFSIAVTLLFALLLANLVRIQIFQHEKYARLAESNHFTNITLLAERGMILDRHGKKLAVTISVPSVWANPKMISDSAEAARKLAPTLGLSEDFVRGRLERDDRFFVWIKRKATPEEAAAVEALRIRGVGFMPENQRFYSTGELASQITGFVNIDNEGAGGIELFFNNLLSGRDGVERVRRDGRSRLISFNKPDIPPRHGASLILSIDSRIQAITREEISAAVDRWNAEWGVGIVMDPRNGDILAMVSIPDYDPNAFQRATADQRRNRAVSDWMEPGSIFKPFVAAALLEEGKAQPDTQFFCHHGRRRFGRHLVRDVGSYGWLSLRDVVVRSSNIGIIEAASSFSRDDLYFWLRRFGFGERTGVELPGEAVGLLRPASQWTSYSMSSLPMGQEIAVTCLQMARGYTAFANGGYVVEPRLVVGYAASDGGEIIEINPPKRRRVISGEVAETISEFLVGVVNEGTGRRSRLRDFQVAGKTGTAQIARRDGRGYEPNEYVASFVAFAPAEAPQLLVHVSISRPRGSNQGGRVAAPIVADIIRRSLTTGAPEPGHIAAGEASGEGSL